MITTIIGLHVLKAVAVPVVRQEALTRFESSRAQQASTHLLPDGAVQQKRSIQHRIPEQLIMTGKQASIVEVSGPIGNNVKKTIALNPDLRVRYFSDVSCREYLAHYYDREFSVMLMCGCVSALLFVVGLVYAQYKYASGALDAETISESSSPNPIESYKEAGTSKEALRKAICTLPSSLFLPLHCARIFKLVFLGLAPAISIACLLHYYNETKELVSIYDAEKRGSFRGDICRTAVLAREGGFYTDMDVEWRLPLHELVDNSTSFMSVEERTCKGPPRLPFQKRRIFNKSEIKCKQGLLNAVIAAEPDSVVMRTALQALRVWYRQPLEWRKKQRIWMGPATLLAGFLDVRRKQCPETKVEGSYSITCGNSSMRFIQQKRLHCKPPYTEECPRQRGNMSFDGLQYGFYEPFKGGKRLVAWPRFSQCHTWGCDGGGWNIST
jgi:hypothetical protein|mmetsp:Transcript_105649/g.164785  ORF Transcript_105649/g.164785 Transcript_105649/m.164785 type:complete len:440 (-) Transcript_105649:113-1432(-)